MHYSCKNVQGATVEFKNANTDGKVSLLQTSLRQLVVMERIKRSQLWTAGMTTARSLACWICHHRHWRPCYTQRCPAAAQACGRLLSPRPLQSRTSLMPGKLLHAADKAPGSTCHTSAQQFMSMSSDTISQIKHENFEAIAGKETSSMRAKCTNAVALEGPCPNVAGPRR